MDCCDRKIKNYQLKHKTLLFAKLIVLMYTKNLILLSSLRERKRKTHTKQRLKLGMYTRHARWVGFRPDTFQFGRTDYFVTSDSCITELCQP